MEQTYREKELKTILTFCYWRLKLFSFIFKNVGFLFCKFLILNMILSLDKDLAR